MTGIEIPAVLSALSALSSILSAVVSIRQLAKSENIPIPQATEVFMSKHKKHLPKTVNSDNLSRTVMSMTVISDAFLEQLEKEAREHERKHIRDRQLAGSIAELDEANDIAKQRMCHVLRDMKKFNKGVLPEGDEFHNWWISYGCQD